MSFKRLPKVGSYVEVRISYSSLATDEFVAVLIRIKRINSEGKGAERKGARWNRGIDLGGCVQEAGVHEEIPEDGVRDTKLHTDDDDIRVISKEEYERRKFAVQL